MVHFCPGADTNSTLFTNCCGTAICDDEARCPRCKKPIPLTPKARWNVAMIAFYGHEKVQQMRREWDKKKMRDRI
jgi:hypothetical protein